MAKFSEDQLAEYQEVFALFDNRGDGKIFAHQLGEVLRALGHNPTEEDVRRCGYHNEPETRVSFEIFLPILQAVAKNKDNARLEDFVDGFRVFDKDQAGYINSAELRHLLTSLGGSERLSEEECECLLQGQEDAQGNVNIEEFCKNVMNG